MAEILDCNWMNDLDYKTVILLLVPVLTFQGISSLQSVHKDSTVLHLELGQQIWVHTVLTTDSSSTKHSHEIHLLQSFHKCQVLKENSILILMYDLM